MRRPSRQSSEVADTRRALIADRISVHLGNGIGVGGGVSAEYILDDLVVIPCPRGSTPSEGLHRARR